MLAKSAIFVDFDNVFLTLWDLDRDAAIKFASEPSDWLQVLANTHLAGEPRRWLMARCYLNPAGYAGVSGDKNDRLYFSRFRPGLVRAGFEVVDCPVLARGGKNAADIRIVIDALDLLDHRTRFDEVLLASGDSDFTPLLQRLRAEDRRITILSPGYLSSAYSAIADRIVDFDGIRALLNVDAELPTGGNPECPPTATASNAADIEGIFTNIMRQRYEEANEPLNLAALAHEAARACPDAKQTDWFGKGSFSAALASLDLPHVRFSQHHMWDEERHQPPFVAAEAENMGLSGPIALLERTLDLPRIDGDDWPQLFAILSDYGANHPFNLTEATRWSRDVLTRNGVPIARSSIGYVIRGAQIGGVRLDAETAPSADDIARAFLASLLDRAASLGLDLDTDAEDEIAGWLGIHDRQSTMASSASPAS